MNTRTFFPLSLFTVFSLPVLHQDIKSFSLNPLFIYIGTASIIIWKLIFQQNTAFFSLLSGLAEFLIFLFVWLISRKKMGIGDIKYSFFCGLISGSFMNVIISTLVSSLSGIFFILLVNRKGEKKIPFTPFMFFGTLAVSIVSLFIK